MSEALPRTGPASLPVLYNRTDASAIAERAAPARQPPTIEHRPAEFRAEPPHAELRVKKGPRPDSGAGDSQTRFAAQQIADSAARAGLLANRRPMAAGYAAYRAAARQGDPEQPRPGQTLDVSV